MKRLLSVILVTESLRSEVVWMRHEVLAWQRRECSRVQR